MVQQWASALTMVLGHLLSVLPFQGDCIVMRSSPRAFEILRLAEIGPFYACSCLRICLPLRVFTLYNNDVLYLICSRIMRIAIATDLRVYNGAHELRLTDKALRYNFTVNHKNVRIRSSFLKYLLTLM